MKKVIIDGVEYVPVTPEVKEEKRREIVVVNKFNSVSSVCSDFKVTGITGAMRNLERAEFVEIRENEIIVSESDVSRIIGLFADGMCEVDCLKVLFKKDGGLG